MRTAKELLELSNQEFSELCSRSAHGILDPSEESLLVTNPALNERWILGLEKLVKRVNAQLDSAHIALSESADAASRSGHMARASHEYDELTGWRIRLARLRSAAQRRIVEAKAAREALRPSLDELDAVDRVLELEDLIRTHRLEAMLEGREETAADHRLWSTLEAHSAV